MMMICLVVVGMGWMDRWGLTGWTELQKAKKEKAGFEEERGSD